MFSKINNDHIIGAAIGVGACTVAYYVYKKNECQVDSFLKKQGINMPASSNKDFNNMNIEELMETKELIEDVIAEKEVNESSELAIANEEN